MCHFITATLPGDVDPDLVAPRFVSHKFGFELISNPHVTSQIDSGDWCVLTTRKHCDCGTSIGALGRSDTHSPIDRVTYARETAKFHKRGWSEARISRWLAQMEHERTRQKLKDQAVVREGAPDLDQWIGLLRDLLGSGTTARIGLLLHCYSGSIKTERIKILGRKVVKIRALTPEQLLRIEEDVLNEFVT